MSIYNNETWFEIREIPPSFTTAGGQKIQPARLVWPCDIDKMTADQAETEIAKARAFKPGATFVVVECSDEH